MRKAVACLAVATTLAACGSSDRAPPPAGDEPLGGGVEVLTELSPAEAATVAWALGRFELAGLELPAAIAFEFGTPPDDCVGDRGHCRPDTEPPVIEICEPAGDTPYLEFRRRVTMLHELAHVWHWHRGNGAWSDERSIVGGEIDAVDTARPEDRMEERVADTIAWGLLDQLRRPLRLDVPCVELALQFVLLTGHRPLGPIDAHCTR